MLEYDINDALALLEKNISTAKKSLGSLEEDLDFLRDQFTTTEVSILFSSMTFNLKDSLSFGSGDIIPYISLLVHWFSLY